MFSFDNSCDNVSELVLFFSLFFFVFNQFGSWFYEMKSRILRLGREKNLVSFHQLRARLNFSSFLKVAHFFFLFHLIPFHLEINFEVINGINLPDEEGEGGGVN